MSEKEARIYLTILELWSAPASTIARRAWIKRATTYGILKDMMTRQIVSWIEKKWIMHFQTIDPQRLHKRLENRYVKFEEVLPHLIERSNVYDNKPQIVYYEGISWLKELYDQLLFSEKPIFSFLSDDQIQESLGEYLNTEFVQKRRKEEIHASVIVSDTAENVGYITSIENDRYTKIKITDNLFLLDLKWEVVLYGDENVAFFLYSPDELVWYMIKSKQLYTTMKAMFSFIWSTVE